MLVCMYSMAQKGRMIGDSRKSGEVGGLGKGRVFFLALLVLFFFGGGSALEVFFHLFFG